MSIVHHKFIQSLNIVLLLVLLSLALSNTVFARQPKFIELPEMEVVPGAHAVWVGRKMIVNGVPTSIKSFTFKGKPSQVINFYRKAWKDEGTGQISVNKVGSELVLGLEWRGFYKTVQFTYVDGVVKGKLVVSATPDQKEVNALKTDFPLLPGNHVKSRIDSDDFGVITESITVNSRRSVSMNIDFTVRHFEPLGWVVISDTKPYQKRVDFNQSRKVVLQKGNQLIQVAAYPTPITGSRGCEVMVHWKK